MEKLPFLAKMCNSGLCDFSMTKFMDFDPKLRTFVGANQAEIGVGGKSGKIQSPGDSSRGVMGKYPKQVTKN